MLRIGELLKQAREKRNISLSDIEQATKIRKKNLTAIENAAWENFPSKTYVIGIIKSYVQYLNMDWGKLLPIFRREYELKEEIKFKKRINKKYITSQTKKFFTLIVIITFTLFSLYFGWQLKLYFSPPKVEIIQPKKTVFTRENKILLVGKTGKESIIKVNGERVYQDKDNFFRTNIALAQKNNTVVIEVIGANGRKTVIRKTLIKK